MTYLTVTVSLVCLHLTCIVDPDDCYYEDHTSIKQSASLLFYTCGSSIFSSGGLSCGSNGHVCLPVHLLDTMQNSAIHYRHTF